LEHFKLSLTFDNSYAITLKVRKIISPFLLSKITRKNIRKIKQAIAKEFDISAEDIFFNIEKFSIKFKLKDNTITISV
jgi:argininosuccinate lyase